MRKSKNNPVEINSAVDNVLVKEFTELIDERFTNYAFAVMEDRALPDGRDGLKPSQRRTLVAMDDLNLRSSGKTKKCAKICGDVSGNYHPHGEAVIYPTLVRMAQEWSLRYPLIHPQGNFGSPAPEDKQAQMRYTEAKFSSFGDYMVSELSNQVVNYIPNYNDEMMEPTVLPSLLPNLIINGCSGIAVGWATNMAPHNLRETANLISAYIKNQNLTIDEMLEIMPGPDFPLKCKILGSEGIRNYFTNGRGSFLLEGYYTIEQEKNGQSFIKIVNLPFGGSAEGFCREIKELVESRKIEGITNLKNLTNKRGMDVRVWVHKSANVNVVLNLILKHTCLRTNFSVNTTVLLDGKKVVENVPMLKLVETFVDHRKEVITRKFNAELDKNNKRIHILEGLIGITSSIDAVIKLIRNADNKEVAAEELVKGDFVKTKDQAEAVLRITLGNLTKLDTSEMQNEFDKLSKRNTYLVEILSSDRKLLNLISKEQLDLAEKIGDDRRCEIIPTVSTMSNEELIKEESIVVSLTKDGYIKRVPLDTYKAQNRGGKGVMGVKSRDEDEASSLFFGSTHDYFMFFTKLGNLYKKKGYDLPLGSRTSKGIHINNLLELADGDELACTMTIKSLDVDGYFIMVTKNGLIKKSEIREYNINLRKKGTKAINIVENDELKFIAMTEGNSDVMLFTTNGLAARYHEDNVRSSGKNSQGCRAMVLKEDDSIASMICFDKDFDPSVLVISSTGYGKRTDASEYRSGSGRFIRGLRTIDTSSPKVGKIVGALAVAEEEEFLILTGKGLIQRVRVADLRLKGRAGSGIKIISLNEGDTIQSIIKVDKSEEIEEVIEENREVNV
jgi:DNA gyrase subunit A